MAEVGLQWLVYIDDAESDATPTWKVLPAQRTAAIEFPRDQVSANHKGNSGWSDTLTVSRSVSLTVDGLTDENDAALNYLVDTVHFGATTDHKVHVRLVNKDGDEYIFWASMELSYDAPAEDFVTYSATFTSRGTVSAPVRA